MARYSEDDDYGTGIGPHVRTYQGEDLLLEGDFVEPTQKEKKKKALSLFDQLVRAESNPDIVAEPMVQAPEASRGPASSGMPSGLSDSLIIGGAGMLGALLGGGDASEGALAGQAGIKQYADRQERDGAAKLKAYLANKKSTSATKHQKFKYKDKDGVLKWGSYNPQTKEYETSDQDLTATGGIAEWNSQQDRREDRKDLTFGRKRADDFTKSVVATEDNIKKLEESYKMLGSGILPNEVAIRKILTSVEPRLTDKDYDGFVADPSLVQAIKVKLTEWKTNEKNPRLLKEAEVLLRGLIDSNRNYIKFKRQDLIRQMKEEGFNDYAEKLGRPYQSSVDTSKRKSVTKADKLDEGATIDDIKAQIADLKKQLGQ